MKLNEDQDTLLIKCDISDCYRYGVKNVAKTRPIIVEFVNAWKRHNVFNKKKLFKGTGYAVSEMLTPRRYELYKEAKEKFKTECWTRNGKIAFILKDKKYFVSTADEYSRIIANK